MTSHQTTAADSEVAGLLAQLAGVADRLVSAVSAAGEVRMATAGSLLASTDRLTAAVVEVLSRVTRRGVIADEGLSVDAWLRTLASRTIADERMLACAVERLADMPQLRGWFAAGQVSWPAVRGIVAAVRNLTGTQRAWVDATLAQDHRRVCRLDAEELVAAVAALADRARPDLHRERERRAARDEWLRMQETFDGWTTGQFQLGPESADSLRRALATTTPPDTPDNDHDHDRDHRQHGDDHDHDHRQHDDDHDHDHRQHGDDHDHEYRQHDDDHDHGDDGGGGDGDGDGGSGGFDGWRRRREQRNAKALAALCNQRLGLPGGAAPSAARPSLLLIADIAALGGDGVGSGTAQLLTLAQRGPVELTAAGVQRLACDATWRVIVTDGDVILGATAAHPKVSAALRAALVARDGGCRFPACRQPAELCENHHVIPVDQGGPTVIENLALLCLAHHHAIHDSRWANTLHADGTMTFTRRGVTLTSVPRTQQRLRPPTPPPPGRPTRPRRTAPPPRDRADPTTIDPDPPPVDLPF